MSDPQREIEQFLEDYYRAFAAREYARIAAEMYRAPVVMTTEGRIDLLSNRAEVEEMFSKMGHALVADGYARSELLASEISVLNEITALAATRFRRLREDGTEIINAGATYLLLREAERWQVSAATLHAGDRLVSIR